MSLAAAATWAGPDGKPSAALGWLESVPGRRPEPNRQPCELFTGAAGAVVGLGTLEALERVRTALGAMRHQATFELDQLSLRKHTEAQAFGRAGILDALLVTGEGRMRVLEVRGGVCRLRQVDDVWAIGRRCETAYESLAGSLHELERGSPEDAVRAALIATHRAARGEWGELEVVLLPKPAPVAAEGGR